MSAINSGSLVPPGHGPAHLEMLLFRYIETLEMDHALRVLGRWPNESPMGYYAAMVLRDLPINYFQQPRMLPTGPRFVYQSGILTLKRVEKPLPMEQLHPDSTLGAVGCAPQNVLSAPLPQRRLRPLNSFMFFRSFAAALFPGIPQKIKSHAISQMWKDDPLKSQWAILAKSYTIIRDHFKVQNPSLQDFVAVCLPLVGLANAQQYLNMCGWEIISHDNDLSLLKTGNLSFPQHLVSRTLAVDQVVTHCKNNGYALPRDEEWPKHILPDGAVFAVERSYNGCASEPQDWIRGGIPQWPLEEFEADETYSDLDCVFDSDIPVIYDPEKFDLDVIQSDFDLVNATFNRTMTSIPLTATGV